MTGGSSSSYSAPGATTVFDKNMLCRSVEPKLQDSRAVRFRQPRSKKTKSPKRKRKAVHTKAAKKSRKKRRKKPKSNSKNKKKKSRKRKGVSKKKKATSKSIRAKSNLRGGGDIFD